jgi:hypothetical protein
VTANGEYDAQHVDRRIRNEALFRTVNEKLRALNAAFERFGDENALFLCECSRIGCIDQIELAVETFDGICLRPNSYIVRPGHQTPEVERVVSHEATYLVVERAVAA